MSVRQIVVVEPQPALDDRPVGTSADLRAASRSGHGRRIDHRPIQCSRRVGSPTATWRSRRAAPRRSPRTRCARRRRASSRALLPREAERGAHDAGDRVLQVRVRETIAAFLPPIRRRTVAATVRRRTSVQVHADLVAPVNVTPATRGLEQRLRGCRPGRVTRLNAPGGTPGIGATQVQAAGLQGVELAGFSTTVLPATSAAPPVRRRARTGS